MTNYNPPESQEWLDLVAAFEECMQLEGHNLPMAAHIQKLKSAYDACTSFWGDQWEKARVIEKYLAHYGA